MKDKSFEKTERAKHRKKQMKNTKIPKLILLSQSCFYGRLKVIRSLCGANLDHVNQKNTKKSSNQKDNNNSVYKRKTEDHEIAQKS